MRLATTLSYLAKCLMTSLFEKRREVHLSDPHIERKIEMVRMFDLGQYTVLNPVLHHYGFRFSDGSYYAPIGILSIVKIKDELIDAGVYVPPYIPQHIEISN